MMSERTRRSSLCPCSRRGWLHLRRDGLDMFSRTPPEAGEAVPGVHHQHP
nr:MAG TPA: hypothetical protein [Caudoviricetes sp.]